MITLSPYQSAVLTTTRRNLRDIGRTGVLWMPTGSGKTKTTVYGICDPWLRHSAAQRLVWLVERQALVGQAVDDLRAAGWDVATLWSEARTRPTGREQAYVASIQSLESSDALRSIFEGMLGDRRTIVVVDEVHAHLGRTSFQGWTADTGASTWLGLTATPWTNGAIGLADRFGWLACGPSYAHLMSAPDPRVSAAYGAPMTALTPCRYRVPGAGLTVRTDGVPLRGEEWDEDALAEQAEHEDLVDALLRWSLKEAPTGRRVVFCVRVAHAALVASRAALLGLRAAVVAGSAEDTRQDGVKRKRAHIFHDLEAGRLDLVASCDALSRGWDSPSVEVGLMLRPWRRALSAYVQQAGRIVRPCASWKRRATLLDAAGNIERWGTLEMQPVPRYDDLRSRARGKGDTDPLPRMRRCECGELTPMPATECQACKRPWPDAGPTERADVPHTFEGADPDVSGVDLEARLTECERRRLWYARELAAAVKSGEPPWSVDRRAREAFGVGTIRPEWRLKALYGGLPTEQERACYRQWVERCADMRRGAEAEKRSRAGWVADMMRREGM